MLQEIRGDLLNWFEGRSFFINSLDEFPEEAKVDRRTIESLWV
jgi:hypothetical protein